MLVVSGGIDSNLQLDLWLYYRESTRLAGVLVALLICQISQPSAANHQFLKLIKITSPEPEPAARAP